MTKKIKCPFCESFLKQNDSGYYCVIRTCGIKDVIFSEEGIKAAEILSKVGKKYLLAVMMFSDDCHIGISKSMSEALGEHISLTPEELRNMWRAAAKTFNDYCVSRFNL